MPTFDPTIFPGIPCVLWIDPSDATSLISVATGTTGGDVVDGATAGTALDKSGNSNHLSQATAGLRPTYEATGTALGAPCLQFYDANTPTNGLGPYLAERVQNQLINMMSNSYTVLILADQKGTTGTGIYQAFLGNSGLGDGRFHMLRITNKWNRHAGSTSGIPNLSTGIHALAYVGTNREESTFGERIYVDTATTPTSVRSAFLPTPIVTLNAITTKAYLGNSLSYLNGSCYSDIYAVYVWAGVLSNAQLAQAYASFNTQFGTSFTTSAGTLTAPTNVTASAATKTTLRITSDPSVGGTGPLTVKFYRSTTNGTAASIAVPGNLIQSSASFILNDTGLTAQTTYYYVVEVVDNVAATVRSTVLTATTKGTVVAKLAILGDSISTEFTSNVDPKAWVNNFIQAAYPALEVLTYQHAVPGRKARELSRINHGSGSAGGGMITAIVAAMVAQGITHCSLMAGTNDWTQFATVPLDYNKARYLVDMADIISALTTVGITVYTHEMPWRTTAGAGDATTGILGWNNGLDALTYSGLSRQGDTSLYADILANPSKLVDGIHLTGTVAKDTLSVYWANAIGPTMASDLIPSVAPVNTPTITLTNPAANTLRIATTADPASNQVKIFVDEVLVKTASGATTHDYTWAQGDDQPIATAYYFNGIGDGPTATGTFFTDSGGSGSGEPIAIKTETWAPSDTIAVPDGLCNGVRVNQKGIIEVIFEGGAVGVGIPVTPESPLYGNITHVKRAGTAHSLVTLIYTG